MGIAGGRGMRRVLDRERGRGAASCAPREDEEGAIDIQISAHHSNGEVEVQLGKSPSLDNLPPADDDDEAPSLVESELLGVYDTCRRISNARSSSLDSGIGERDISINRLPVSADKHAYPCEDTYSFVPPPPEKWPQRPILLRPSPESGMIIRGVRYSSSDAYLPLPGTGYCSGCTLPVNNGLEAAGKCLVIDFESELFVGTAMLRIKNICDALAGDGAIEEDSASYFCNKKRTFQGVVRGRFKVPVPMSECVTGQVFNRPAGHLPPRIMVKGAVAVIGRLAPQLQARLEGDCPRFLSPLVSTAQSAASRKSTNERDGADESIEGEMCEPQPSDPSSLMQDLLQCEDASNGMSQPRNSDCIATRIKSRKRAFDKLFASRSQMPTFDPNAEFTFEFFQHLILFDEFALNFIKPIGKHSLRGMLNGQPLKFMAAHQLQERGESGKIINEEMRYLWSFDLWHESLL